LNSAIYVIIPPPLSIDPNLQTFILLKKRSFLKLFFRKNLFHHIITIKVVIRFIQN